MYAANLNRARQAEGARAFMPLKSGALDRIGFTGCEKTQSTPDFERLVTRA